MIWVLFLLTGCDTRAVHGQVSCPLGSHPIGWTAARTDSVEHWYYLCIFDEGQAPPTAFVPPVHEGQAPPTAFVPPVQSECTCP